MEIDWGAAHSPRGDTPLRGSINMKAGGAGWKWLWCLDVTWNIDYGSEWPAEFMANVKDVQEGKGA